MPRHAPGRRDEHADFGPDFPGRAPRRPRRRWWLSLPSPILAIAVLVFVVLPVVWPETEDVGAAPSSRGDFKLAADVTAVAVTPDGGRAAATGRDRPVVVWQKGEDQAWSMRSLPEHMPTGSRCLAAAADGRTLAAGNVDGSVSLWDMASGERRASLAGGTEMVLSLAFSPDGRTLASAGGDTKVRIWDVASAGPRATLDLRGAPATSLSFGPDGRQLACGCEDGIVRVWGDVGRPDAAPLTFVASQQVVLAVAFSPDGRSLASASLCGRGIDVWNVPEQRSRGFLPTRGFSATCLGFTPDGLHLIAGEDDGTLGSWNALSLSRQAEFPAHSGWVKALAVAQGAPAVLTGGNDGYVRRWDLVEVLSGRPRR
ncbi:WD domain, G-beta repeat [Aquisphaera giovannonii]|uniref:WD domain, G-beta repeat n=1 Tax=Aquisphaera giovannonii TaxID=406548 RepID=A0A5B9W528_9BACT|nr:WD40 repeat domain-containing protein [Aquisphaera giovannonii]QEH35131.1 WD domain, G-beta repeat [Aquisphaera giovannonii]